MIDEAVRVQVVACHVSRRQVRYVTIHPFPTNKPSLPPASLPAFWFLSSQLKARPFSLFFCAGIRMASQSTGLELPELPTLPPLEMPDDSSANSLAPPLSSADLNVRTLLSPTPSFASRDSFSTAYTSPSQAELDSPSTTRFGESSLAPPQNLRKSLSVDSFVNYGSGREVQAAIGPRPNRGNTGSAINPPRGLVFGVSAGLKKERELTRQAGRTRGESMSSSRDGHESSYTEDSDVERSDPMSSPVERYRHASLKGHDQPRPYIRGGELPLPSRTPTLSSTSSMSSIMSASTSSSTLEDIPRLQSAPSLQSLPRQRGPKSNLVITSGRTRSGSLGVYAPSTGKRMLINTQIPGVSDFYL